MLYKYTERNAFETINSFNKLPIFCTLPIEAFLTVSQNANEYSE